MEMNIENMPILRPIPMNTKNMSWWKKIKVWANYNRIWKLEEDWTYTDANNITMFIHRGFEFNAASVPKIFHNLMNPVGTALIASIIHDYGYQYGGLNIILTNGDLVFIEMDQKSLDTIFKNIVIETTGMKTISHIAHSALWSFGFVAWNNSRKKTS